MHFILWVFLIENEAIDYLVLFFVAIFYVIGPIEGAILSEDHGGGLILSRGVENLVGVIYFTAPACIKAVGGSIPILAGDGHFVDVALAFGQFLFTHRASSGAIVFFDKGTELLFVLDCGSGDAPCVQDFFLFIVVVAG